MRVYSHGNLGLASHDRGKLAETDAQDGLPERVGACDDGGQVWEDGVVVTVEEDEGGGQEEKDGEVEISGPHAARRVVEDVEEVVTPVVQKKL